MQPIVTDQVARSVTVCLSVCHSMLGTHGSLSLTARIAAHLTNFTNIDILRG